MRILGIDPGTSVTGWGVLDSEGGRPRWVASGSIVLSPREALPERLRRIRDGIAERIREFAPGAVGLEKAFVSRNVQSALRLGEARGAALIAAADRGLPVFEYAPAEVKAAVVGYGRADKRQILRAMAAWLGIEAPSREDEADALAVALCHLLNARSREVRQRLGVRSLGRGR
jgi:crossover junction endodeoxyribonuclease RuvC